MFPEIEKLLRWFRSDPEVDEALEHWTPPTIKAVDPVSIVREALQQSRLVNSRESDVAFYVDAERDEELNGRDTRKRGTALSAPEKAERGIRYRGILTHQFLDTLTDEGLLDPVEAGWIIANTIRSRIDSARQAAQAEAYKMAVELIASNGAAGPCFYAGKYHGKKWEPSRAPLLPVESCAHPGQCFCIYKCVQYSDDYDV
jgi:hypothetical protein